MHGKKVLVTGAGGFIGSHLVEALVEQGATVRAFIHYRSLPDLANLEHAQKEVLRKVEVIKGDITDPFSVKKALKDIDIVFHLAALIGIPYSYCAPQSYVNTNIIGTLNVLQAALDNRNTQVIHTSTSETYGSALYSPIDEKHPLQGQSPYSASKIGADKIAESFYLSFALPVTIIRPFNTYGPRQSARAIIPTIISQALTHPDKVKLGSLSPIRDFTYVSDTVSGFIQASKSQTAIGKTINLGTGKSCSIQELVDSVKKILNLNFNVITDESRVRPEKSEVIKLLSNPNLAKETFNWSAKTSLLDGLEQTIEFIKRNPNQYKPQEYQV